MDVPENFHPRYNCISKEYVYLIWNSRSRNPLYEGRALHFYRSMDSDSLNDEIKDFLGTHDFTSLSGSREIVNGNIRTVKNISIERQGELVKFTVEADGFLYHMVRNMVGIICAISDGKISSGEIINILEKKDRRLAGMTAPAEGLYLNKVFYGGVIDEKTGWKL